MKNKRIINIRPFFVIFVGIMLGILTCYGLYETIYFKYANAYLIFGACSFVVSLIMLSFSIFGKFKKFAENKFLSLFSRHLINIILLIISIVVGMSALSIKTSNLLKLNTYTDVNFIEGKVEEYAEKEAYYSLVLSDVVLNAKEKLNGELKVNIFVTNSQSTYVEYGDKVQFKGEITLTPLITSGFNFDKFSNTVLYTSSVSDGNLFVVGNEGNVIDEIRQSIYETLENNFNAENAQIATGMLLDTKSGLSDETSNVFSYAGISHVLAVSGLHVGFLVAFILAILKLCKVKLKYSVIIIAFILLFYSALCNFTPSVLRASFMALVLLFSKLLGERYDALTSLSIAGILILLIFPLDLFNVGFQLSFLAVLSIITLSEYVGKLLTKIKLPKSISNVIAISVCVNLVLLPICANTFNYVSLVGIFSNLIIIPLFSVTYPLLFSFTLICTVFPFISFVFIIPNALLHAIKLLANLFAEFNFAHFKLFNMGYLIVFFIILFALVVKFLMVNNLTKGIICGVLTCAILGLFINGCMPKVYNHLTVNTTQQYSTNSSIITTQDNKKILVGFDKYTTENMITEMKINSIDLFVAMDFELNDINNYVDLIEKFDVKNLLLPNKYMYNDYTLKKLKESTNTIVADKENLLGIEFEFIRDENKWYGLLASTKDDNVLFLNKLTTKQLLKLNDFNLPNIDYLFSNTFNNYLSEFEFEVENIILSNKSDFENSAKMLEKDVRYVVEL